LKNGGNQGIREICAQRFPRLYFLYYLCQWLYICVTGGEPLLHEDLEVVLSIIKDRRLLVKIDTNGSFPLRLEKLIDKGLVDYVAMDIKNSLEKYEQTVGVKVKTSDIKKSIEIIRDSGLDYIFRTTVVPDLVEEDDIRKIGQMLKGSKAFQIQQFVPNNTLDELYIKKQPYSNQEIEAMTKIAQTYFEQVKVEGV